MSGKSKNERNREKGKKSTEENTVLLKALDICQGVLTMKYMLSFPPFYRGEN